MSQQKNLKIQLTDVRLRGVDDEHWRQSDKYPQGLEEPVYKVLQRILQGLSEPAVPPNLHKNELLISSVDSDANYSGSGIPIQCLRS